MAIEEHDRKQLCKAESLKGGEPHYNNNNNHVSASAGADSVSAAAENPSLTRNASVSQVAFPADSPRSAFAHAGLYIGSMAQIPSISSMGNMLPRFNSGSAGIPSQTVPSPSPTPPDSEQQQWIATRVQAQNQMPWAVRDTVVDEASSQHHRRRIAIYNHNHNPSQQETMAMYQQQQQQQQQQIMMLAMPEQQRHLVHPHPTTQQIQAIVRQPSPHPHRELQEQQQQQQPSIAASAVFAALKNNGNLERAPAPLASAPTPAPTPTPSQLQSTTSANPSDVDDGNAEERRQRRMQSNRESARRSRQRKQQLLSSLHDHLDSLSREVSELRPRVASTEARATRARALNSRMRALIAEHGNDIKAVPESTIVEIGNEAKGLAMPRNVVSRPVPTIAPIHTKARPSAKASSLGASSMLSMQSHNPASRIFLPGVSQADAIARSGEAALAAVLGDVFYRVPK